MSVETRHIYRITPTNNLADLIIQLNRIFDLLMDRLDNMEAIRGYPKLAGEELPTESRHVVVKEWCIKRLCDDIPQVAEGSAGSAGTSDKLSRCDHKHALGVMSSTNRGGATVGTGLQITGTDTLGIKQQAAEADLDCAVATLADVCNKVNAILDKLRGAEILAT